MLRSPVKRRRPDTGPSLVTVELVLLRAGYCCERCGIPVVGQRGMDWSLQHRVPRQMGGSTAPWINSPTNLLLLDGSATTGCHGEVESRRAEAVAGGYAIAGRRDPATVPVLILGDQWKYLSEDGHYSDDPPEAAP